MQLKTKKQLARRRLAVTVLVAVAVAGSLFYASRQPAPFRGTSLKAVNQAAMRYTNSDKQLEQMFRNALKDTESAGERHQQRKESKCQMNKQ